MAATTLVAALNISERIKQHREFLQRGKHHNWRLQAIHDKYGWSSLTVTVVHCHSDLTLELEQQFIDRLRGPEMLNIAVDSCSPMKGLKHTEEARRKMRGPRKPMPEEQKRKISAALKGKRKSVAHCKKLSEVQIGKVTTDEHRANLSRALTGKPKSAEHCKAVGNAKKRWWAERKHAGHFPPKDGRGRFCSPGDIPKPT